MSVHPDADRIDWNGMKDFEELRKSMDEAIAKSVKARNIAIDALTEEQVCQVFKEAIACGDISMHVVVPERAGQIRQGAMYIPFAEKQRLESRIKELERALEAIRDKADPYTHQIHWCREVAREALALAKEVGK